MEYNRFTIRNKNQTQLLIPVETSGFIGSWSDAYVGNGIYIIALRDYRRPEDDASVTFDIGCVLPAENGKVLGFKPNELNSLLINAVQSQQEVVARGVLKANDWMQGILGRGVLFVDKINFK